MIHNVARILELAVPLVEHPGESFMAQLEEDMMKLILKHGMMVCQQHCQTYLFKVPSVQPNLRVICLLTLYWKESEKSNPKSEGLRTRWDL